MDSGVEALLLDHLPWLARLATQLTGDPDRAGDLLTRFAGDVRHARHRLLAGELPEPELRTLLVRRFIGSGWQRVTERRDRACRVLLVAEGLTRTEVAAIVDAPVSAVPAGHPAEELGAELSRLAEAAPDVGDLRTRLSRAEGERAPRTRRTVVGAAAIVALVAAAAVPTVALPRLPKEARRSGEWVMAHDIGPSRDWRVLERTVTREYESTALELRDESDDRRTICNVWTTAAGSTAADSSDLDVGTPIRVNGRPGFEGDDPAAPTIAWRFADDAWAAVWCDELPSGSRDMLYRIADAVRFRRTDLRLPFALDQVPAGYRIGGATDAVAGQGADVIVEKVGLRPGDANVNITFVQQERRPDVGVGRAVSIDGRDAILDINPENSRLCVSEQGKWVCLLAYWPNGNWPERAPVPAAMGPTLIEMARGLRFARTLGDRETWFTAAEALG